MDTDGYYAIRLEMKEPHHSSLSLFISPILWKSQSGKTQSYHRALALLDNVSLLSSSMFRPSGVFH